MSEVYSDQLAKIILSMPHPVIAVSGGVDSLTLAAFAANLHQSAEMIHAVSPAVPQAATARVRQMAAERGWSLQLIDAGEFSNPGYLANPANRCFFCKSSLYGTMSEVTDGQLLSGTNQDDLSDWRPGLEAAKDHDVRHPFVEAGMTKDAVRALAKNLGLAEAAQLPASPCLSSRVETGLPITAEELLLIDRIEQHVRLRYPVATVRCRIRAEGIGIEIDREALGGLDEQRRAQFEAEVSELAGRSVKLGAYRMGSAFLRAAS
ncbi:adenine nucleotide alpha hydrolase [Hoeflea sp.]|uniref:adenine nucleotide alpha hydrolase n=1 Tax=unclassified Hoeflea TaxID=2614931 RepID=UPI002AFF5B25|nr:adenine nucleotide alpha hydrolase [Hoeflea sp.]